MAAPSELPVTRHAGGSDARAADRPQPVFYYDLASPSAYLAAERIVAALGVVPEFQPIAAPVAEPWAHAPDREARMAELERRALVQGLLPLRWPAAWPTDAALALRAATYARGIGKVAAFSLAAFRQAFAGGRDLAELDTILLAGAACEIHPAALIKALERSSLADELARASAAAASLGVTHTPAVRVGEQLFVGEERLEQAGVAVSGGAT